MDLERGGRLADIRNHVDESAQLPKVQGLPRNLVSQLLTGARLSHRGRSAQSQLDRTPADSLAAKLEL